MLEFDGVRELLRGYAASELGRGRVAGLRPSADLNWIQRQQQLTTEVREFRRAGGDGGGFQQTADLVGREVCKWQHSELNSNRGSVKC